MEDEPDNSDESRSMSSFQDVERSQRSDQSDARRTVSEAHNYIRSVAITFRGKPWDYQVFSDIMKDFKEKRASVSEVTSRVKELLVNHPDLLEGFNLFLPTAHQIPVPLPRKSVLFLKRQSNLLIESRKQSYTMKSAMTPF